MGLSLVVPCALLTSGMEISGRVLILKDFTVVCTFIYGAPKHTEKLIHCKNLFIIAIDIKIYFDKKKF